MTFQIAEKLHWSDCRGVRPRRGRPDNRRAVACLEFHEQEGEGWFSVTKRVVSRWYVVRTGGCAVSTSPRKSTLAGVRTHTGAPLTATGLGIRLAKAEEGVAVVSSPLRVAQAVVRPETDSVAAAHARVRDQGSATAPEVALRSLVPFLAGAKVR